MVLLCHIAVSTIFVCLFEHMITALKMLVYRVCGSTISQGVELSILSSRQKATLDGENPDKAFALKPDILRNNFWKRSGLGTGWSKVYQMFYNYKLIGIFIVEEFFDQTVTRIWKRSMATLFRNRKVLP